MEKQSRIFLDLLKYSIGAVADVPSSIGGADWTVLYDMAKQQALIGVLFHGISKLPKGTGPDTGLLMKWMAVAQQIRQMNIKLNRDTVRVSERFRKEGFRNCILKGQGNALLYPDPYMRTPGDIDIYLEGGRERIMAYVDKVCPGQTMRYHHVDFPVMSTPIEVHFTPSYMHSPTANRRIQRWFGKKMEFQCTNMVELPDGAGQAAVPTAGFNLVYILAHLYRHVFSEGIGLRQLLDYYFILTRNIPQNKQEQESKPESDIDCRNEAIKVIESLGMRRFACGIMYVLHVAFGLQEKDMLFEMNERDGKFLLNEIMYGGNFGQYDTRLGSKENEGKLRRYFRLTLRNLRFVRMYPSEALSEPLFRTTFAIWRILYY